MIKRLNITKPHAKDNSEKAMTRFAISKNPSNICSTFPTRAPIPKFRAEIKFSARIYDNFFYGQVHFHVRTIYGSHNRVNGIITYIYVNLPVYVMHIDAHCRLRAKFGAKIEKPLPMELLCSYVFVVVCWLIFNEYSSFIVCLIQKIIM